MFAPLEPFCELGTLVEMQVFQAQLPVQEPFQEPCQELTNTLRNLFRNALHSHCRNLLRNSGPSGVFLGTIEPAPVLLAKIPHMIFIKYNCYSSVTSYIYNLVSQLVQRIMQTGSLGSFYEHDILVVYQHFFVSAFLLQSVTFARVLTCG